MIAFEMTIGWLIVFLGIGVVVLFVLNVLTGGYD